MNVITVSEEHYPLMRALVEVLESHLAGLPKPGEVERLKERVKQLEEELAIEREAGQQLSRQVIALETREVSRG